MLGVVKGAARSHPSVEQRGEGGGVNGWVEGCGWDLVSQGIV